MSSLKVGWRLTELIHLSLARLLTFKDSFLGEDDFIEMVLVPNCKDVDLDCRMMTY